MQHRPRKQRTRQHVIADLAVHHVEGFILRAGHAAQRVTPDYGYDLFMSTFDDRGWIEPGFLLVQCKATERIDFKRGECVLDIDIRDYNLWMYDKRPVVLIRYDASRDQAFWTVIQEYFRDPDRRPRKGARTVRIRIPRTDLFELESIEKLRTLNRTYRPPSIHRNQP